MLANLSWRELLIAACVLLAVYAAFVFFRINALKQDKPLIHLAAASPPHPAVAAYAAEESGVSPFHAPEPPTTASPPVPEKPQPRRKFSAKYEPQEPVLRDAAEETSSQKAERKTLALEREVEQLRKEVGGLRAEILLLREACRETVERSEKAEREEVEERKHVIPPISPFYNDAMQMAAQGESIESISQFCGISRAEAELVVALARNRDNGA
jgi:type IV secretory pathway VirB10-like protein